MCVCTYVFVCACVCVHVCVCVRVFLAKILWIKPVINVRITFRGLEANGFIQKTA